MIDEAKLSKRREVNLRLQGRAHLGDAVKEWLDNAEEAKKKYGHISDWDVSEVTDFINLFKGARNFNEDLSRWDTGKVTDMGGMFDGASSFNQPLNSWDTSNVTNMRCMFTLASSFNQPLNSWDTSNVTDMSYMFVEASSFGQPLNDWNTENLMDMTYMFDGSLIRSKPTWYIDSHRPDRHEKYRDASLSDSDDSQDFLSAPNRESEGTGIQNPP